MESSFEGEFLSYLFFLPFLSFALVFVGNMWMAFFLSLMCVEFCWFGPFMGGFAYLGFSQIIALCVISWLFWKKNAIA